MGDRPGHRNAASDADEHLYDHSGDATMAWRAETYILAMALMLAGGASVIEPASAQDATQYLDITSDEFTKAEMTRADIEAALAALAPSATLDLSGKRLNKLDLSGMDLTRTKLTSARINGCKLNGANFSAVSLDGAWALKSDFRDAKFIGASLFQTQMMDAILDGADFSNAMVGADLSRASLLNARFNDAMLAPDLTNQSMGLMRGVLKSAKLDGASFKGANLRRSTFEYASLKNVDFEGADLAGSELSGADFTGANVKGANFAKADINGAKLVQLRGRDAALGLDAAVNRDKAIFD
jgi:BTB/POZ domain-containing protein KCTD9